ncbi:hypothetical protein [Fimbriiglobus ruber]|uniref:Uncharacterized protein n=1 Tax=Fimbriiglobus ruber TaxID=1908690 RepID=A0A225DTF9_9BACT|nr:hypothetical protein [Fimbriiglobus ruber]OWK39665.1 hypothetical protein FRUB_05555 [Fimbriiglobus ruber]
MVLAATLIEGKIIVFGLLAFFGLIALIVYLPVALVREVARRDDEELPDWMGTVRGRRMRLRVVFTILGGLAVAAVAAALSAG